MSEIAVPSGGALAPILSGALIPCRPWPRRLLSRAAWAALAAALAEDARLALIGLWADAAEVHALFLNQAGWQVLPVSVAVEAGAYPALSPHRPGAAWFERAVRDLWGHRAEGGRDQRPWLDHGRWPAMQPMAPHTLPSPHSPEPPEFLPVEGEDLHQLALGPVQGDIAASRHLRLTCLGETVVRLEARLGYAHRGVLSLMQGRSPHEAARLAARLAGDATVAHGLAFAGAVEAALGVEAPPRARYLRAAMLELERVAGHLGDLGAVCDAVGLSVVAGRFALHGEAMRRAAAAAFGHRLMMDRVLPGGIAVEIAPGGAEAILSALAAMRRELPALVRDCAGLTERMAGVGVASAPTVTRFAPGGVVGRAAGRRFDARLLPGGFPCAEVEITVPVLAAGDAEARMRVRLGEIEESARLLRELLAELPEGPLAVALPEGDGEGIGCAEGARGDVWHWLRLESGRVAAAFARDPGWLHWPLLEMAAAGAEMADLPLIERSFGAACAGVDL